MIVKEASLAYLFYFSKKCNSGNVRNTAPSLNREGPSLSIHSNTQHKNSANNDSHTGFTGVQPKPSSKEKKKKKGNKRSHRTSHQHRCNDTALHPFPSQFCSDVSYKNMHIIQNVVTKNCGCKKRRVEYDNLQQIAIY